MSYIDDARAVGARLRAGRAQAGLSQRKLAFPGCSAAYISRIEVGERVPSLQLINELARRIGTSAAYLAKGVEESKPEDVALIEADVALRLGEVDEAREIYESQLEDEASAVRLAALAGLGQVALRSGELEEAVQILEEVVATREWRLLEDPASVDALGRAYAHQGELESAIALFEHAYDEAQRARVPVEALRFAVLLANARADNGELDAARAVLSTAIKLANDLSDPLGLARVYWTQSRVHVLHNDPRLARRFARKALNILERTENDAYIAMAYHLLAYTEIEGGEPAAALPLLAEGRAHFSREFAAADEAKFSLEEARALLALRRKAPAAKAAARALEHIEALDPQDRGRAYAGLADTFAAVGDRRRARELYERALGLLHEHGRPYLVDTARRFAELLEDDGEPERALEVLKSAVSVAQAAGRMRARATPQSRGVPLSSAGGSPER